MKKTVLRTLALCLTAAFASGYAFAQADTDSSSKSSSDKYGTSRSGRTSSSSGTYSSSSASSYSSHTGKPVRLSKLMNQSVKNQQGESLGQVQDIIVDPDSGQLQFIVLSLSPSAAGAPG